jgi:carbonic anhydrase
MPWKLPFNSFTRPLASSAIALACAAMPAWAAGGHADATSAKSATAKDGAASDPMDALRQKLADRLGAQKPADNRNANTVRVDNRSTGSTGNDIAVTASRANGRPQPALAPTSRRAAAAPAARPVAHGDHWDYAGEGGPEDWGKLKPEYSQCATGQRQSPIDIRGGIAVQLEPIQFDYRTTGFSVIDNGHTVQVNLPAGNTISVLGRRFELLQFHFHRPSEERINGKQYDMVAHLVHKDAEGKLAVVAVLLDRGVAQPLIQAVWNALPLEKNEAQAAPGTIDLNKLLPEDRRYYTYMGSLTTPPCSEGVLWMVMKTPVPVSPEQIEIFSRLYPMNARPVQPQAGRLIKESS